MIGTRIMIGTQIHTEGHGLGWDTDLRRFDGGTRIMIGTQIHADGHGLGWDTDTRGWTRIGMGHGYTRMDTDWDGTRIGADLTEEHGEIFFISVILFI